MSFRLIFIFSFSLSVMGLHGMRADEGAQPAPIVVAEWDQGDYVGGVAFDGERVISFGGNRIQFYDRRDLKRHSVDVAPDSTSCSMCYCLSPDSRFRGAIERLPNYCCGHNVEVWALEGSKVSAWQCKPFVTALGFSTDSKRVAVALEDGGIQIYTLHGQKIFDARYEDYAAYSIRFSPDGQYVAVLRDGSIVQICTLEGGLVSRWTHDDGLDLQQAAAEGMLGADGAVSFSPDGNFVVSGGPDNRIQVRKLNGEIVAEWKHGNDRRNHANFNSFEVGVSAVSFSPCGQFVASGGRDDSGYKVKIHRLDATKVAEWQHKAEVTSVSFSPGGGLVASGGFDGEVRLYDVSRFLGASRSSN